MSDFLPPVILRLAADISEYTEKLAIASAQLEEFTNGAGEKVERATRTIGAEGEEAGRRYSNGLPAHATEGAERAVQDVTTRLRDHRGRFTAEGESHGKAHGEGFLHGIQSAFSSVFSFLGDVSSRIGSTLGTAGKIAGGVLSVLSAVAFPALIAAAVQTLPAIASVAGALGAAIPAAATAAAGALATVFLGFHGLTGAIGAAFAPAAGGAVAATNAVANAEWNLKQAQQQAIQTQEALNQARVAAAQNIKDLALAMSGAKLSVEEAQLAVKDADAAWRAAFATGNQDQIYRTNLALRQAQQHLAEAQNSSDKTAAQKEDADKRGVEGSQGVQSALQAQANAAHSLEQAQQALTQAMKGAGGAASALATAMAKLAPSARAVVEEIIKLKPALHDIQQTVQQHMFVGFAGDLDHLAHAVLPGAKAGLVGMADQFNVLFRGIAQGMSTPAFSGAMTATFAGFTKVLSEFAALAPKGVAAFSNLLKAAAPFMQSLGEGAAKGLGHFLDWINRLAENKTLEKFFASVLPILSAFGGLMKDVGSILSSVFGAINGMGGPALGVIGTLIHSLAEFFKSAEGSRALIGLFQVINPLLNGLSAILTALLPPVGELLAQLGGALQPALTMLIPPLVGLVQAVAPLIGMIGQALVPVIETLAPALASIINAANPLIAMLGGALGQVLIALAPILAQVATVVGDILAKALTALMPLFQALLPPIVQLVQALLPSLVPMIQLVATVFDLLLPILTPIIKILTAILVPILQILTPVIAALAPVIGMVADALVWILTPIADFIAWLVKGLSQASTWKAIGHWFVELWHTVSDAFMAGVHWVAQKWDEMIEFTKAIPKRVTDAIGDFKSLLINKGKDLVTGLWNGIVGMGAWLSDKLMGWVKDVIPGPIAKALGIGSPSKVAADLARWVPVGIAQGMDEATHHVTAASGRLANAMVPSVDGTAWGAGGLPTLGNSEANTLATVAAGGGGGSLPPINLTIPIQIGGNTMQVVHLELIPHAQRYKARTGTTGLS